MTRLKRSLTFLLRFAIIGLAVAFVLVFWFPNALGIAGLSPQIRINMVAPTVPSPGGTPGSYSGAVKRAAASVANLYANKVVRSVTVIRDPAVQRFFGLPAIQIPRQRLERSLGSAVIVSSDGYLLTNLHVIEGAQDIRVSLMDGREVEAQVVGADTLTDLAVLKTELSDLPAVTFAPSAEVEVGDVVLAIGNPFGIGQTVTMGIVGATERSYSQSNSAANLIQTDAAINRGNSGGALINANGNLVGINTLIYDRESGAEGIGFAIPSDVAAMVTKEILEHGSVRRSWLGVDHEQSQAEPQATDPVGVVVSLVHPNSPADMAGIRRGDVVLQANGIDVTSALQLGRIIGNLSTDETISLTLMRDGREQQTEVVLRPRPEIEDPVRNTP